MSKSKKGSSKAAKPKRKSWFWLLFRRVFVLGLVIFVGYLVYLNTIVVSKFEGQKWDLPAHVYARPLELYAGLEIDREDLVWELDQLGYRSVSSVQRPGQYRVLGANIDIYTRPFSFWDGEDLARQIRISTVGNQIRSIQQLDGGDTSLVRLEPKRIGGIYPDYIEDRLVLSLDQIPDLVQETLLLVEDRSFYDHYGVSPRAIIRALVANMQSDGSLQGGSTLTQQLVKNFYLTHEQTLVRKAQEALMALLLEIQYSKPEILETYFNEIYFGQSGQRAINGIGLASQYFFRQPIDELDIHQIAYLIGMIKGPANYDPWRNVQRGTERRDLVLRMMAENGLISEAELNTSLNKPLDVAERPGLTLNPYPAYMQLVQKQLQEGYSADQLETGGLKIFTAFDPVVQERVESSVVERMEAIESGYGIEAGQLQSAVVVTQVGTGEVVAIMGDRTPGFDGFNRATNAQRPIGSLIKPVLYLTALNRPNDFTLGSLVEDAPIEVPLPTGEVWSPENYGLESHGMVPLYEALAKSYNQSASRLGLEVGVEDILQTLTYLGVEHDMPAYPSMLLGAGGLTPLQVSTVYHTLAAEGFYTPANVIRGVYTPDNQPLQRFPRAVEQRVDPRAIHLLQYAMQVAMREGTGRSAYNYFPDSVRLAGKTGTTNDLRDSWFAGFGGTYVTVVWVGRDDNGKTPLTGATGALAIWNEIMSGMEKRPVPFVRPSGIEYVWVEPQRNALSAEGCAGAVYLPFVTGSEPKDRSPCLPERSIGDKIRDFLGL